MDKKQRNWYPIDMLAVFSEMIDGMLENDLEQIKAIYSSLNEADGFDNFTVNLIINVYSERLDDRWLFNTQLARWKEDCLSENQGNEVDRLIRQMTELKTTSEKILKLVQRKEYKHFGGNI